MALQPLRLVFRVADAIGSELEVAQVVFHELFHLGLSKSAAQDAYVSVLVK
jgi:hypothetical protein